MPKISVVVYDGLPQEECAVVDAGLGQANDAAAPLHEVRSLSCFARVAEGQVVGGAIGRWWGSNCELQQLWVEPSHRRQGLGARLLQQFEVSASSHGCTAVYLETFSFQAPQLYVAHGYKIEWERTGFPHGIVKYHMLKRLRGYETAA